MSAASDDLLGAHLSSAGGTFEAPGRATAIAAHAMQIFTKMGNRWAERDWRREWWHRIRRNLTPAERREGLDIG